MAYGRHSILTGQVVDLRAIFRNDAGDLVSTDALPDVYIYDESTDVDTIEAEILAQVYTSALAGPLVPTLVSTGYYSYSYTVPSGATAGVWHDVWSAQVDTVDVSSYLVFGVDVGADLSAQTLGANQLIMIELDSSIADSAGDYTLGEDVVLSFLTVLDPLHASPDMLRLQAGSWINHFPDSTVALMIHWSSLEADFITGDTPGNAGDLAFAKAKFCIYDAALRILNLPGGYLGAGSDGGNGTLKSLGDLKIDRRGNGTKIATTSSGIDIKTLNDLQDKRDEWFRVVNAGGNIVPGQGLDPTFATKGLYDENRRNAGRQWESPGEYSYAQPSVNHKTRKTSSRYGRFGFSRWRR